MLKACIGTDAIASLATLGNKNKSFLQPVMSIDPKWAKHQGIQLEVHKTLAIKQVLVQAIDLYLTY